MKPSQIKKKLRNKGISVETMSEKKELVEALAQAFVDQQILPRQPEPQREAEQPTQIMPIARAADNTAASGSGRASSGNNTRSVLERIFDPTINNQ